MTFGADLCTIPNHNVINWPLAIQTAVARAQHEAGTPNSPEEDVKLKTEHIQEVIDMSQVFKEYLRKFDSDEARWALQAQARIDKEKDSSIE